MYHHHHQQQQQQVPQAFSSGPRPPPNQQPIRPPTDMMPPPGPYQFPRPTQLPDELESALSVRGSRDMDHRLIEHLDRLKQHQQASAGMSQHGNYSANLCDTQPKPSVDWSNYEPPSKLFGQHPGGQHPGGQHPGGHPSTGLPNWNAPMSSSPVPPQREGGRGFYTPESAGTILASFGLSNEDLEALSHYPDDQLTPDTLPFILRDLQVHKKPKSSRSPEVPSLLTVTQTEGRVIDYGHASQAKDESGPPKTFKKEPISSERTVKMYPSPAPKLEASVGRQVRLEPAEPTKHGDRDYRRRSSEHHSSHSPPPRDFSTSAKQRHQDRDYRLEQPKPRPSAEKRSGEATVSKPHPPPSTKPLRPGLKSPGNKKLPTPTMMSDFSGALPKVYPHTCSLCNMQCDQEQEWIGHLGTVNHTAACRHLRTKYPDWKPKLPSRDYGKRAPAAHSASRSTSWSLPPPLDKHRGTSYKLRGKPYAPQHVPRHHPYHTKDVDARYERPHARGGANLRRPAFREHQDRRELAGASRNYLKRPQFESRRYPSFKGDGTKKTPLNKAKTGLKPGYGTRQADDGPPAKKKKVAAPVAAHGPECMVYLTDIPKEATEQEVINLAGSFGPINNVLLMPSHEDEEDRARGQQASVCMMKAEDAQTFANAPNLLIRDRVITATVAKNPEEQTSDAESPLKPEQQGGSGEQTFEKKKGVVLIEDLPESGWTEEDLKALAEPFGYLDNVIVAKQIGKALLIMPDVETAQEMVKVHSFSPLSVNERKVTVKNVHRNIGTHTPVALYNLLMHSVDAAVKAPAVGWGMLVVVSNVPQTPSSASVVHKLVSRIGTVFKTLAVNNLVICEMATGPLATAVFRHYLKFPCMIQNNPLVFSRKPDPKTPVKVIPAFLDTDRDVPEEKKEAPPTAAEENQNEICANPEPTEEIKAVEIKAVEIKAVEIKAVEIKAVEIKCEQTEEEVVPEKENPQENTTAIVKEEPMDTNTESTEEAVKVEPMEKSQTNDVALKENGAEVQAVEEAKVAEATEGEAAAQNTTSEAKVPQAVSAEKETPAKAPKPSTPSVAQKQTPRDPRKDPAKNSHRSSVSSGREDERRRSDRDWREKDSRDRERRERERSRKDRDYDERSKREYERERRADPRRDEARREDPHRNETRREDPHRNETRREDPHRNETRREDPHRNETRREDPHRDETRREDPHRDETRREDPHRDETRREDPHRDETRREDPHRDEMRREDPHRDETRREDPHRDEMRREDPHRDETRREDPHRDKTRRDDPRKDDVRREEMKRAWRREWERREGKRRPYADEDFRRSDGSKRSHHRDREDRYKSSSERRTIEDDFPFNLSDFVTVDEVGDVDSEALTENKTETGPEPGSDPGLELGSDAKSEPEPEPELELGSKPEPETVLETQTEESPESRPPQNLPLETEEKVQDISMESCAEEPEETEAEMTEVKPEEQTAEEETKETTVQDDLTEEAQTADVSEITDEPCPDASEENGETNQEEPSNAAQEETAEVTAATIPEEEEKVKEEVSATEKDKDDTSSAPPAAEPTETSENGEKDVTENAQSEKSLPPFDANSSVGLEYLVPMTGFFCKVCTRFFTGAKDAQLGHSKTLKHYENLEKFLKSSSADEAGSS